MHISRIYIPIYTARERDLRFAVASNSLMVFRLAFDARLHCHVLKLFALPYRVISLFFSPSLEGGVARPAKLSFGHSSDLVLATQIFVAASRHNFAKDSLGKEGVGGKGPGFVVSFHQLHFGALHFTLPPSSPSSLSSPHNERETCKKKCFRLFLCSASLSF